MQSGVGDGHAADKHGRESGDWRDGPGASNLHLDIEQRGRGFLGRKFMRDGKPGRARHETERALRRQIVDLVDDAVDIVGQSLAPGGDVAIIREQPIGSARDHVLARIDRQTHGCEPVEHLAVAHRRSLADFAPSVGKKP